LPAHRCTLPKQLTAEKADFAKLAKATQRETLACKTDADNRVKALLRAYKAQNGVEMNFRFLKDPVIVNETFLKKAERIEALGFILLLSLMVWNLIQTVLREHLEKDAKTILGWDKKQTCRPTTLMVIFYFQHISVFKWNGGRNRRLSRPLLPHQRDYLQALGLAESIFTTPVQLSIPPNAKK